MTSFCRMRSPSSLTVDLALARVDLATLQLRKGLPVDEQVQESARLLHQFFSRRLRTASPTKAISEQLVPRKDAREALQRTLTTIPRTTPLFEHVHVEVLTQLVELLSSIVDTGECNSQDAEKLHSVLCSLQPRHELAPSSSTISKIPESLDASH